MGGRGYGGGGKREIIYLSLHCHHQNDSCIKMGSDESHFNVSLTVTDKVTRQCPQTTALFEEKGRAEAESNRGPSAYQPYTNALPLGQTGSQFQFKHCTLRCATRSRLPCGTCGSLSSLAKAEDVTLFVVTSHGVAGKGYVTLRAVVCHL